MIRLSNICAAESGYPLFHSLDLIINSDEHCVIQGPNGSGKTSLLRILAGKLHTYSGIVEFDFIDRSLEWDKQFDERLKNVHWIPALALHDVLGNQPDLFYQQRYYSMTNEGSPTVRDYLANDVAQLRSLGFPTTFNVEELLPIELVKLSNGQIKKVLIIKQLLKNVPKVLLLDYPFEGLDRHSRLDLCVFLDQLAKDFGIQLILTDHHHLLPHVINRRILLEDFKIIVNEPYVFSQNDQVGLSMNGELEAHGVPVVEMKNVSIRYGDKTIIANLNWRIHKGERWALTGRNGSGKTTLFSLIYADHPMAYSQAVYLFGKRRGSGESIWDIKKRINYLGPEQLHFLSGRNALKKGKDFFDEVGDQIDRSQMQVLLSYFEAEHLLLKPMNKLSSGELQLLYLILFFLSDKELLLLDEPFQFLDPQKKRKVSNYLQNYLHPDSTLVLITHYEDDIRDWTKLKKEL